jgi:hypothetical protein
LFAIEPFAAEHVLTGGYNHYRSYPMHRLQTFAFGLLFVILAGCTTYETGVAPADGVVPEKAIRSGNFGQPMFAYGSQHTMAPYSVSVDRKYLPKSAYGGAYLDSSVVYESRGRYGVGMMFQDSPAWRRVEWNNLAFVSDETGMAHLLLDHRAIIASFYYPTLESSKHPPMLIFTLIEKDTSGDGLIDGADAQTAYVSDLSGRNIIRVTPIGTNCEGFVFDPVTTRLFFAVRHDTDGDGHFNYHEYSQTLVVHVTKPAMGKPLLPDELREDALRIYQHGNAGVGQ